MKKGFDWQSEDDQLWEQRIDSPVLQQSGWNRRLVFVIPIALIAIVLLLVVIGFQRRMSSAEEIVAKDVTAAQTTMVLAVQSDDLELFTSLLSRDNAEWFITQRRLFLADRILGREAFGINTVSNKFDIQAIKIDPNWRQAEVTFTQWYQKELPNGESQPVQLEQTYFLKVDGNRWQLAEPEASFWGSQRELNNGGLAVTFPARDVAMVQRIVNDLQIEIRNLCGETQRNGPVDFQSSCNSLLPISIDFDSSPDTLVNLSDLTQLFFRGRSFRFPAPTLVGIPVDEEGYQALYAGYTDRILRYLRNNLNTPIPLPNQRIVSLCFPTREEGLGLYAYDPQTQLWSSESIERRYNFLQSLPQDDGIILRGGFPGTDIGRLQLTLRRLAQEEVIFEGGSTEMSARLVEVVSRPNTDYLVLSLTRGNTGITGYQFLSLAECEEGDCTPQELPGYPVWSPDGQWTLMTQGAELYLGDSSGIIIQRIGRAYNPFWLTTDTFGYVRLPGGSGYNTSDTEIVLQSLDSNIDRALIRSSELMEEIEGNTNLNFRIQYVAANPSDPNELFLAGSPVSTGDHRFFIVKLTLDGQPTPLEDNVHLSDVEKVLVIEGLPVGDPSVLTPTGYRPFSITGNGRWLMVNNFVNPVTNQWRLLLYDTEKKVTKYYNLNYPPYPSPFPFYDWSSDWHWLLIVDNGYFRLAAPEMDYERLVPHEMAACRYSAWIN